MPARWAWRGSCRKRLGSRYRSGRSPDWLKFKNPEAPAVRREAEEDRNQKHLMPDDSKQLFGAR
jgi:hypothetical protein